ncbi:hypothetical protein [uncultured Dokdonia sp.]|uniref:hypothetical protein n=1 Tax=uncultured Dokdonia sp. TaxID=575653 RepID=UPI002631865D|nr:hypothetical protein [uncultured Dokdonia sp.]
MLRSICIVSMSNLIEVVDSLEHRIDTLVNRYQALKERHELLEGTIASLDAENKKLKDTLEERQKEINTLKAANALLGSNDYKRETKLKINTLIREIDACMVSLSE